jgi:hypothetical protein
MKTLKDFLKTNIKEEAPPETDAQGHISPEALHHHFDINKDGKVDMHDYAAHIAFHCARPEFLAKYMEELEGVNKHHAMGNIIDNDEVYNMYSNNMALVAQDGPKIEEEQQRQNHLEKAVPPAVLIMRRKSIRQFPNGKNVAMYYIDKLNKYVTIPYSTMAWAPEEKEINPISVLKKITETTLVEFADGTELEVTPNMANAVLDLHRKVNDENKAKMQEMLATSSEYFNKVLEFTKRI